MVYNLNILSKIDSEEDIRIFLEEGDLEKLEGNPEIEGLVIDEENPWIQGPIILRFDDGPTSSGALVTIERNSKNGELKINATIKTQHFSGLYDKGIGLRHDTVTGSKIDIYNDPNEEEHPGSLFILRHYRDNRENYLPRQ